MSGGHPLSARAGSNPHGSGPPPAQEQRRDPRKILRGPGFLVLAKAQMLEVRTLELGQGGIALLSRSNLTPMGLCSVKFSIPRRPQGHDLFELGGVIVHCIYSQREAGFKVGVQFDRQPESFRRACAAFLRS